MKPLRSYAIALACSVASASLFAGNAWAQAAANSAPAAAPNNPASSGGAVALREVDIRAFIEDVSNATGRTFIIDPRVTGRVTVLSQQTMSADDLLDVFMSTLRVNGYVAVPTAQGAYRIVPNEVAAREPGPAGRGPSENTFVTQVFTLQFADAEAVVSAIRPMLTERGQAGSTRRGNSVIVVDYGSTVTRLRDVIARLDRDTSVYRSMRLRNTSAAEMARVAASLSAPPGDENHPLLQAVAVPSSNTLVLRGDQRAIDQVASMIEQLDSQADYQSGVTVIPLRYAVAEELVPILQQVSGAIVDANAEGGGTPHGGKANIASHRPTNSLVISADPETQETLANVVRSLDVRRQQILVEAIIVEVSDQTARELGLQFLLADPTGNNAVPFLSTSYSSSAPNLLAVTGALLADGDSSEESTAMTALRTAAVNSLLGSNGLIAGIGGTTKDGSILGVILNALSQDTESNVLSTPSVMTLDNETANILVGQQIPVTTGEAVGSDLQNQFRTIRRQDVGVQLEVRPQISEGGAIRLEIKQEVSSIFGPVATDSTDLITNRREISTVVQVDAGQVIVLGGLIQEDRSNTSSGIPGLRSIPIAGHLFSSEGRSHKRTNLMVFLRPTIVNTPEQANAVTIQQLRALQGAAGLHRDTAERLEQDLRLTLPEPTAGAPASESPAPAAPTEAPPAPTPPPQRDSGIVTPP